jgi:membrane glycosyltransferase
MSRRLAAAADFQFVDRPRLLRRVLFFGVVLLLTAAGTATLAFALSGDGLRPSEVLLIVVFTVNLVWIALSFMTGLVGVVLRVLRIDPATLRAYPRWPAAHDVAVSSRTVVVIPVHNEAPERVFAGLRAMYRSLDATGHLDAFDFFVLSDTRDPDLWIAEELIWAETCRQFDAVGRIFYRRRWDNAEKKPGNLKDFCERWGSAYDFMIVLDADSVMSGDAMVRLVGHMEATPDAGIIQALPMPTGYVTPFARILQFISRVHGPSMAAGLAFWQLGTGNYWGHNAIIRIQAFLESCGLPVLPGNPPLGGPILSHDFVEAALMRRAGWSVWMAPDIEGSWEELPPNVIDYAIRDRRWCQGNLQHLKVLKGRGLKPITRLHLFMGVMSYLSSPLWLLLLVISTATAIEASIIGTEFFPVDGMLFPNWPIDRRTELGVLLAATLAMLVLPKLLSLLVVAARRRRDYGGLGGLLVSGIGELLFSALLAPLMMLMHSRFVMAIAMGRTVDWKAQTRGERGVDLASAFHQHRWHVVIGIAWSALTFDAVTGFFWWLLPVVTGLIAAPFITHFSSRPELGRWLRRHDVFMTPEETAAPEELDMLAQECGRDLGIAIDDGLRHLIESPSASALHAALLPDAAPDARTEAEIAILYEKLERLGPESLSKPEKILLLSYPVRPLDQIRAGRRRPTILPQSA